MLCNLPSDVNESCFRDSKDTCIRWDDCLMADGFYISLYNKVKN
jgi:hypothetical protein